MKFQLYAAVQIGSEYTSKERSNWLKLSYYLSMIFLIFMIIELLWTFEVLGIKRSKEELKCLNQNSSQKIIQETELFTQEFIESSHPLLFYQKVKHFIIQFMIASLQVLGSVQITLIFLVESFYLGYFLIETLKKKRKIFQLKVMFLKTLVEEISIFVLLLTILIYHYTEKTDFIYSTFYNILEWAAFISIFVAFLPSYYRQLLHYSWIW